MYKNPKGGRPPFKPTKAQRESVTRMVAVGMSEEDMAYAIGCQRQTLRKHFRVELKTGHGRMRAKILGLLEEAAENGNVSAQKFLVTRLELHDGRAIEGRGSEIIGKKEQRQAAAEEVASGKFAPPEPPKLVVNNR